MFDIHNYDKEEYEKERRERLKHKERHMHQMEEEVTSHYDDNEQEGDNRKKILLGLLLGTVGIVGYLGFNYLQDGTNQPKETVVPTVANHHNELNSSKQKETTQELITTISPTPLEDKKEQKELTPTISPISTTETSPIIVNKEREIVATVTPKISKERELNVTNSHNGEKKPKIETIEELSQSVQKIVNSNEPKKVESPKVETKKIEIEKVVKEETIKREKPKRRNARVVIIRKGDTLASISKKFYGNSMKFQRIINANYSIKSSSTTLHLGQKIYVPR
ncbi:LysM peptidoglycan-binding domain-containing protein [Sulfurovum sp. bin170]|uniref:LysM peptidoglycan-binding domain-containing protein n=1 Tax=Sulfurovum sp. bin170 TaxID=2695268 RepID=UPI0013E01115|nr:LysM peptidoglycan-binding domain-containing protein [Sulfurovum sp. bin170]NEW60806.1 LysM peptidoglycan-binding domain-containing protein [Sulfurovum sp. bin170]